jgi:hypothetical protein
MGIKEYAILKNLDAECSQCEATEYLVIDKDGDIICTDCLFERQCEEDGMI